MSQNKMKAFIIMIALTVVASVGYAGWNLWLESEYVKGETAKWKTYKNDYYGFRFQYPPDFVVHPAGDSSLIYQTDYFKKQERVVVTVGIPENAFHGTNFVQGYVTVAVNTTIAHWPECQEFLDRGNVKQLKEKQIVNGITFYTAAISGVAAGTLSQTKIFHTLHDEKCYELSLNLFTTNVANYEPGMVEVVDENKVWGQLESILSTFKFTG
jgi:hypothetical protein